MLLLCRLALQGPCSFCKHLFGSHAFTSSTVVQRWHSKPVIVIFTFDRNFCQPLSFSVVPREALEIQTLTQKQWTAGLLCDSTLGCYQVSYWTEQIFLKGFICLEAKKNWLHIRVIFLIMMWELSGSKCINSLRTDSHVHKDYYKYSII